MSNDAQPYDVTASRTESIKAALSVTYGSAGALLLNDAQLELRNLILIHAAVLGWDHPAISLADAALLYQGPGVTPNGKELALREAFIHLSAAGEAKTAEADNAAKSYTKAIDFFDGAVRAKVYSPDGAMIAHAYWRPPIFRSPTYALDQRARKAHAWADDIIARCEHSFGRS